jgi:hypothetical protein
MLYIRLFHGRSDPEKDMDKWGSDGPVFGPYQFVQMTYTALIRLIRKEGDCDELHVFEDMIYYDGVYYGDGIVFDDEVFKQGKFKLSLFEIGKAKSNF